MTTTRPLIVGEVLFDQFPDGQRVLGGAPFNVAWNLQGLGYRPLFVSAVGSDEEGREVRARMEAWGMDTAALQVSEKWPTGRVRVELNAGEPHFHILNEQAYDDIHYPDFDLSCSKFSMLYVGSLAYRNATSRSTIRRLTQITGLRRFVDINIRQPWFDRDSASELLEGADWIKLNLDELAFLAKSECRGQQEIVAAVAILRRQYHGRQFFVTCGADGAYAMGEDNEPVFAESPKPDPLIDPVGAGDAFASAVIVGIHRGRPLKDILTTAVRYASETCSIQGATSTDPTRYALVLS